MRTRLTAAARATSAIALRFAVASASVLAVSSSAMAQATQPVSADAKAKADALFKSAREAMNGGDYKTAKSHLLESQALDPSPGTQLNIAICEAKLGRPKLAVSMLDELLTKLPANDPRRTAAETERKAAEALVGKLTLMKPDPVPAGLGVTLDGEKVDVTSLGTPLRVNPGEHVIEVSAEGRDVRKMDAQVEPGGATSVVLALGPPLLPVKRDAVVKEPSPPKRDDAKPSGSSRTLGFVIAGIGGASLVASGITGVLALGKQSEFDDLCGGPSCKSNTDLQTSKDIASSGKTLALISTVTLAAGVVGLGVGGFLIFSAKNEPEAGSAKPATRAKTWISASAAPLRGGGRLSIAGAF